MKVVQLFTSSDPDGVLRLNVPLGKPGEYRVTVIVSSHPAPPPPPTDRPPTPEELGWPPGYLEKTFGSIDDDTFVAPPRGPADPVEPLD